MGTEYSYSAQLYVRGNIFKLFNKNLISKFSLQGRNSVEMRGLCYYTVVTVLDRLGSLEISTGVFSPGTLSGLSTATI